MTVLNEDYRIEQARGAFWTRLYSPSEATAQAQSSQTEYELAVAELSNDFTPDVEPTEEELRHTSNPPNSATKFRSGSKQVTSHSVLRHSSIKSTSRAMQSSANISLRTALPSSQTTKPRTRHPRAKRPLRHFRARGAPLSRPASTKLKQNASPTKPLRHLPTSSRR